MSIFVQFQDYIGFMHKFLKWILYINVWGILCVHAWHCVSLVLWKLNHVKRGRARNSLSGLLPRPVTAPTPNGSVAGSSTSLNSLQHVDKEPKVVVSNPSFVPATPKISNAAEHNRLESDASFSVAALTNVGARDAPAVHKTHSFVGGSSVASASKVR